MITSKYIVIFALLTVCQYIYGGDWPMWRHDAARTAVSSEMFGTELHLQWVRKYPPLTPAFWQVDQGRLQFDMGYEPVVAGTTMFVGSSRNDSVTAIDTETGLELWKFYCDGPVRFAPIVWRQKVYVGSDDGYLYCLDAHKGSLLWKYQGVPSSRKVLGNGRMISVWPIRGGPVLVDGVIYFSAGIWPFEGIFVYALDAETGKVIWLNDRTGCRYVSHPHGAEAFGGPAPQGYIVVNGDELIVPCGRSFPAYFDRKTGRLKTFDFGHRVHGNCPGSWFAAVDERGQVCLDPEINADRHSGTGIQVLGQNPRVLTRGEIPEKMIMVSGRKYILKRGIARSISGGGKTIPFEKHFPHVTGMVHTVLAANGKLFVVTRQGQIYCFGSTAVPVRDYPDERVPLQCVDCDTNKWAGVITYLTQQADTDAGYILVCGLKTAQPIMEIIQHTNLNIIVVDSDTERVDYLRRQLNQAGVYGTRVAVHSGDVNSFGLPPYFARMILVANFDSLSSKAGQLMIKTIFRSLRPFGGTACFDISSKDHAVLKTWAEKEYPHYSRVSRWKSFSLLTRMGAPPGSANYTGTKSYDEQVRAPMGVLWFGDTFQHDKFFSPKPGSLDITGWGFPNSELGLPHIVDGVMMYPTTEKPYTHKEYQYAWKRGSGLPASKTIKNVYTDIYTGLPLSSQEADHVTTPVAHSAKLKLSPSRINPVTGVVEGRNFIKNHGCDLMASDFGYLLTMRSGTAAYYDKRIESGTINISGVRSGCKNSIVPGNGVLCLPHWTGGCVCNYPLATSLALVHMPEDYEQWAAWGGVAVEAPVRRVGINFGAPGDRMDQDGTLWLDYPSQGGPSPEIPIAVEGDKAKYSYHHSVWMRGGQGWPWVGASGVQDLRILRIEPIVKKSKPYRNTFSVQWTGKVMPEFSETYTFYAKSSYGVRLWVDNQLIIDNFRQIRRGRYFEVSASINLKAGVKYDLRMEYYPMDHYDRERPAMVELRWNSLSVQKSIIPHNRLFTADGLLNGLSGVYYENANLTGPATIHIDPEIRFNWGREFPSSMTRSITPVKPNTYTVRLYFAEPDNCKPEERVFSVIIQGKPLLIDLDIATEADGLMKTIIKEFRGIRIEKELILEFKPKSGQTLICGIELIADCTDTDR